MKYYNIFHGGLKHAELQQSRRPNQESIIIVSKGHPKYNLMHLLFHKKVILISIVRNIPLEFNTSWI